ncbi:unnamed protein product, partial [Rotaria sordida]
MTSVINYLGSFIEWYRPVSLAELLNLRHTYPGNASKLVFGNTRVQIETKYQQIEYPRLISLTFIDELKQLERTKHSFIFGAGVTLTRLQSTLILWKNQMASDAGVDICQALLDQLKHFGSTQIRNVVSIGGNIINPLSTSDLSPIFQAADALLELHSINSGVRRVPFRDYLMPHHCVSIKDDEILVAIHIPFPQASSANAYRRPVSHGQQSIPERPINQKVVGSSLLHQSAYLHTTGEAKYTNDIPQLQNTLHAALVLSKQSYARIKHIDISAASNVPGFVSYVSHTDVPSRNDFGAVVHDEEVFASSIVQCVGTIIGLVVCESERSAQMASRLIQIDYEPLTPIILTIDEAISHKSFLGNELQLQRGDLATGFGNADNTLEGVVLIGGQEHFYLETNCCMAVPSNDNGELTLYSSTQDL